MLEYDVLIIGSGLAAFSAAARLLEKGVKRIGVYGTAYGGTPFIAGINFVLPDNPYGDTPEQYEADMLQAGFNIGNCELVHEMTTRTMEGYEFLCRMGVEFAKNEDGTIKLRHLSGHTFPRSLCCTEELIGLRMLRALERVLEGRADIHKGYVCLQLITNEDGICGAEFLREDGKTESIYAPTVIAAWGGVGNLFGCSTYPSDIEGNTLAIAHRAGVKLVDIEFLEYEPMVLQAPQGAVGEPCPTAMLGEGAYLRNAAGERFLIKIRPEGEAGAPKTLLNRQIWKQVANGNGSPQGGVYAYLRNIQTKTLQAYPWFYKRLVDNGVDPNKELLAVGPMAHSFSGGIYVDAAYESSVKGLYAIGEACGGVHGACRCAGNAASQAVMSALICADAIVGQDRDLNGCKEMKAEKYYSNKQTYAAYVPVAKKIAATALGVYRTEATLANAEERLDEMLSESELARDTKAQQIVESIRLMVGAALARKESRGTHMRLDYPETRTEFEKEIFF